MNFSCLTEEEVRYKYRKADNKERMIQILADLTCSSEKEMEEFLNLNIIRARIHKRTYLDKELAKKLYDRGMTDGEIANEMRVSRDTIRSWRKRNGLVCNYYKSGEENVKK